MKSADKNYASQIVVASCRVLATVAAGVLKGLEKVFHISITTLLISLFLRRRPLH